MLDVAAALELVLRAAAPLRPADEPLSPNSVGRVLAADVPADLDSPPFAKALMDGYAVRAADLAGGSADLRVVEEVPAGAVPTRPVGPGEATALFTGAPVPGGADAVVMVERTQPLPGGRVRVLDPVPAGKNVLPRGTEMRAGDVVLPAGTVLTPAAVGLLAAVGRTAAPLRPAPWVAVLATGNELVGPAAVPGPGQIRNSNGPMLLAQAARAGAKRRALGVAPDDPAALLALVRDGLASADVLVLAGGVSAGKLDLVPDALRTAGVAVHFHKVRMKPGKPLLFGTANNVLVFGLPGNPVGAFVGFELFVRPAVRKLAGHPDPGPVTRTLPLAGPLAAANDRPTYHPARLAGDEVAPLAWFGSADLRGLVPADALIVLPPGEVNYPPGQPVKVVVL